jgi:hypothetical protein
MASVLVEDQMRVFIDESGQTGADLYDPTQPVYAVAAVWIAPSVEGCVVDLIDEIRRKSGMQPAELKGARLLRSAAGRRNLRALADGCIELGIEVSLVAFHKPFMAAAVVVEDCTDPAHNSNFSNRWTWDTNLKEPLAQRILDHIDARILLDWWRTRRGDVFDDFVASHAELMAALRRVCGHEELAKAMADTDLAAVWEPKDVRVRLQSGGYSPNVAVFSGILPALDIQAECRGARRVRIVHDEQHEFEAAYRYAFKVAFNSPPMEITLPNTNSLRLPLERIQSLEFARSDEHVGLQVADCMASVDRAMIQAGVSSEAQRSGVPREFRPAMRRIEESKSGPHFPIVVGSLDWQLRSFNALIGGEPLDD